jgi:hypothetical protein
MVLGVLSSFLLFRTRAELCPRTPKLRPDNRGRYGIVGEAMSKHDHRQAKGFEAWRSYTTSYSYIVKIAR